MPGTPPFSTSTTDVASVWTAPDSWSVPGWPAPLPNLDLLPEADHNDQTGGEQTVEVSIDIEVANDLPVVSSPLQAAAVPVQPLLPVGEFANINAYVLS